MAFQEITNKVDLAGQTGSVGTATLLNTGPLGTGVYVVFIGVLVTSAGTGGTITVGVNWNNGTDSTGFDSATFSLSTTGEQSALLGNFYATANQLITYNTTAAGVTGNPAYNLRLRI